VSEAGGSNAGETLDSTVMAARSNMPERKEKNPKKRHAPVLLEHSPISALKEQDREGS